MISKPNYRLTRRGDRDITVSRAIERFVAIIIPDLGVNSTFWANEVEGLSAARVVGAAALG